MTVDAISLAVFRNLFASIAEEMGLALQRSSFSPNIKERQDYSCAVFDDQAQMVAQAAHIPVHLGSMPASVKSALKAISSIHPGDIVVLNDPYHGGTHLPDVTMISPVFQRDQLRYFLASRAHHADMGGMAPGSLPLSTDLYQEGLIIPPMKLVQDGDVNQDLLKLITANTRSPREREGDFKAQMAAQQVGQRRMKALLSEHGQASVQAHARALMEYSRHITESVIKSIPDGEYTFQDRMEGYGNQQEKISIQATVSIQGSKLDVDFSGSSPQVEGNLNAVPAVVRSATWYCIRLLSTEDIPMNQGCFQPVSVMVPEHSLLNPDFPAAVAAGNVETSQRIVDVVLGALAKALPDRIPAASQGTMNNITFGGIQHKQSFVYYETIGGGHGAAPTGHGLHGHHSHMTNTRNTPVEAIEKELPVQIAAYSLRQGSGGEGKYRGGEGIKRVYKFLAPAHVTINSERRIHSPYGLQGGKPGMVGNNRLIRDGITLEIEPKASLQVEPGDILVINTPGGGGWGN